MSDLRKVPASLAQVPLQFKCWLFWLYLIGTVLIGFVLAGFYGALIATFCDMFSFQFWGYAMWNGLRNSEDMGSNDQM